MTSRVRDLLAGVLLGAAVLAVFGRALGHAFLSWDDPAYVTDNARVAAGLSLDNLRWALTAFAAANWHPLTWISHMADVTLFGLDPRGHHAVGVALHLANTVLLFVLLRIGTGEYWRSLLVAALFGIHPLHVESVAWVSERKDLISTLFWLIAIAAYARYARRPTVSAYLLVAVSMALGLMAKPMVVTLPLTLLLLDIWPLRRISLARLDAGFVRQLSRLLVEKLPLLVLSTASAVLTVLAQSSGGAVGSAEAAGLADRLANATLSYAAYLKQFVFPAGLSFFYPYRDDWSWVSVATALVVLVGLTAACLRVSRRRPELLVGWCWYLATLLPVIGLVQVGAQAMADRYTYVPLIGVFVVCAWLLPEPAAGTWNRRQIPAWCLAAAAAVGLAARAHWEVGHWRDSRTLFSRAVAVDPTNYVAHSLLAGELLGAGEESGAERHAREAIRLAGASRPGRAAAILSANYGTLAAIAVRRGDAAAAAELYSRAVELDPRNAAAHHALGALQVRAGDFNRAIQAYRAALAVDPAIARTQNALGFALFGLGQVEEAIAAYRRALELNPRFPETHFNLGVAWEALGRQAEAIAAYRESIRLEPRNLTVRLRLGRLLLANGQVERATVELEQVLKIDPGNAIARRMLDQTGATAPR